ncbi:hypothetical protein [Candidatus Reidiella endopervernicosa]|uniref:Uncharacterized protein n=1 Tax=Candidatus Reidiella endopervernicosa TaxID=2738883 RepID=A0A6N0HTK6_9GAMM|nr:hypothetical protein [Candidatus Reidiella endopervernicosa]QKQ25640.1 hypothetical protein HUE57_04535 [Candidatus Reidiella endopervernicosa]
MAATTKGREDPQLMFTNTATAGGGDNYYCAGPETQQGYGGVISFCDKATAGSASFKAWTGAGAPPKGSTVGGEISFSNSASAGTARFSIYGTLGSDGDTFGNVVFHDTATAKNATFTNVGGTVSVVMAVILSSTETQPPPTVSSTTGWNTQQGQRR